MRRSHMHDVTRFIIALSSRSRGRKGWLLPNKWKMLMGKILSGNQVNTFIVMARAMLNKYNDGPSICWICM